MKRIVCAILSSVLLITGSLAHGAAITAYPQLATPSDTGFTIWYDSVQPVGQRDRTVTMGTFKNSILGTTDETGEDLIIPVTAGAIFVSTLTTDETRTLTLPTFADVSVGKRIAIVHTTGSAGLVTISPATGLSQIDLSPGEGVTVMKRIAAWEITGRF